MKPQSDTPHDEGMFDHINLGSCGREEPMNDKTALSSRNESTYGDAVCTAADHVGIPREQIDRFLGTLQACGWHVAPISMPSEKAEPMLPELCKALGWQGGTIHQALAEVASLKADAKRYFWLKDQYEEGSILTKRGTERFWTTLTSLDCGLNDEPIKPFDQCVDEALGSYRHTSEG